jgi:hypothetical protein
MFFVNSLRQIEQKFQDMKEKPCLNVPMESGFHSTRLSITHSHSDE